MIITVNQASVDLLHCFLYYYRIGYIHFLLGVLILCFSWHLATISLKISKC